MIDISRQTAFLRRNSSNICAILACAGVVATGVVSAIAGYKFRVHEESKPTLTSKSDTEELAEKALIFAPAAGIGVATIGCIVAGNRIDAKTKTELAAACVAAANMTKKTIDEKRADLENPPFDISENNPDSHDPDEELVFMEEFTGRKFTTTLEHVHWAEQEIVNRFLANSTVTLNEFYDLLELSNSYAGDILGWSMNEDDPYLRFGAPDFTNTESTNNEDGVDYYIQMSWNPLALDRVDCPQE